MPIGPESATKKNPQMEAIYLEALRVAVNIEMLDADLGVVAHLLSAVRAGGRQGDPGGKQRLAQFRLQYV